MVEEDAYCIEVMKQLSALQSSLERSNRLVLLNHGEQLAAERTDLHRRRRSTVTTTRLAVPDMTCAHCEQAIERALLQLDGVDGVTVDIAGKVVDVDHDARAVSAESIAHAVK